MDCCGAGDSQLLLGFYDLRVGICFLLASRRVRLLFRDMLRYSVEGLARLSSIAYSDHDLIVGGHILVVILGELDQNAKAVDGARWWGQAPTSSCRNISRTRLLHSS